MSEILNSDIELANKLKAYQHERFQRGYRTWFAGYPQVIADHFAFEREANAITQSLLKKVLLEHQAMKESMIEQEIINFDEDRGLYWTASGNSISEGKENE